MKPFWKSKTFWLNAIGLIIVTVQYFASINIINAEVLAAILAVLNFITRFLTTGSIGFVQPKE